ncbi:MAG: M48 family metalloprotease [Bacteriovoracaceae bacterium]|nr:M48 family metalloprotease [Bacteriovoracaceae bacterium]
MKLVLLTLLFLNASFSSVLNHDLKTRVDRQLKLLQQNLNYDFKMNYKLVMVKNDIVSNAAASFPFILVNENWIEGFSDKEVLAVITHEVAHLEHAHLSKGLALLTGGFVNAVFDINNPESLRERYSGFVRYYKLKQELYADCVAYNWLRELKDLGVDADPKSLNDVVRRELPGIDNFDEDYMGDDFVYTRFRAVRDGHPSVCRPEL